MLGHKTMVEQLGIGSHNHEVNEAQKIANILRTALTVDEFNLERCNSLLNELKVRITTLPSCNPKPTALVKEELYLGRECMELGVLFSIKNRDFKSFERHIALLHPYYVDYHDILGSSDLEYMIKGMHLLYLLAANRLGDFHVYLHQIPISERSNDYIKGAIEIEENLMDGNYNKIFDLKHKTNKNEIYMFDDFFITHLLKCVRHKVAYSLENSCKCIDVQLAIEKLYLKNLEELELFLVEQNKQKVLGVQEGKGLVEYSAVPSEVSSTPSTCFNYYEASANEKIWKIENNKLCFIPKNVEKKEVPSFDIIHQLIEYATELERIV